MIKHKKFEDRVELFLAGNVDLYAKGIVQDCLPYATYNSFISCGGEALVLLVNNEILGRKEVLKILLPGCTIEVCNRFTRSAKLLSEIYLKCLQSGVRPVFPCVFCVGTTPNFIAMQWIDGVSLTEYMQHQVALQVLDKVKLFFEVCRGISYMHKFNLIHRDIKPDNIMIDFGGNPWIIDFGLTKNMGDNALTGGSFRILGTPKFSAPEQFVDAANVTIQSDIYALAMTLYYMLTGEVEYKPELLSGELLTVLPRALQLDPMRRHICVQELIDDLLEVFPDIAPTVPMADIKDLSIGEAFRDLSTIYNANSGGLKKLLKIKSSEIFLWEELVLLARCVVLSS